MELLSIGIGVVVSYLIGSMPTALWVGKAFYGIDIREHGSGNSGASNTFRVLGKKAGTAVLLIDIIKGLTAASLVRYFAFLEPGTIKFVNLQLLFGLSSVFGHIFPIYSKFKGGKGILNPKDFNENEIKVGDILTNDSFDPFFDDKFYEIHFFE